MILKQNQTLLRKTLPVAIIVTLSSLGIGTLVALNNFTITTTTVVIGTLPIALFLFARTELFSVNNSLLCLWVLLIAHRAFSVRVESVSVDSVDTAGNALEIGVSLAVFLGASFLLILVLNDKARLKISWAGWSLISYGFFAFTSLLWTPAPVYAGFWVIRLLAAVIILCLYFGKANQMDCHRFVTATLLGQLPHLSLTVIAYFASNPLNRADERVGGFWLHPGLASLLGFSIGLLFLTRLVQQQPHKFMNSILMLFCFFSAILAGGKTAALGAIISLLFLFTRLDSNQMRLRILLLLVAVGLLGVWLLPSLDIGLFVHLSDSQNGDFSSMYARFDLWHTALSRWLASPWTFLLGEGFTATRTVMLAASSIAWETTHAHNSFFQSFVELGMIGATPIVVLVLRPFLVTRQQWRVMTHGSTLPLYVALVVLLVNSFTDNVFGALLQPPFYLLLGLLMTIDRMIALLARVEALPDPIGNYR